MRSQVVASPFDWVNILHSDIVPPIFLDVKGGDAKLSNVHPQRQNAHFDFQDVVQQTVESIAHVKVGTCCNILCENSAC